MASDFDGWFSDDEDFDDDVHEDFLMEETEMPFELNEPAGDMEEEGFLLDLNMEPEETEHDTETEMPFDLNEPAGDMEEEGFLLDLNMEPEETEHDTETSSHHHQSSQSTETEHQTQANSHHQPSRNRLSSEQRMQILLWLLNIASEGHLQYRAIKDVAHEFNVSRRCISTLWNTAKKQRDAQQRYNVTTKFHNSGRKRIQVPTDQIKAMNMGDRSCIRDLASKLQISKSSVHRMVKRGVIRPHSNPLHPGLKDANKKTRLQWILSLLHGDTPETKRQYIAMYDFVHLDEKWFNLSKKSHRVYLAENEKGKYRSASSSKFIPKVMFTTVVARPRFNAYGECTFDGKIGIFPFTYQEPAKRSSKNRAKGTIITKIVESVNQQVTRNMLINQIVPAIKAKWPQDGTSKVIFIQQDNAKAHINQDDAEWQQVYQQDGFTFILLQQPPNSPDLNILDLGFFRSIQSLMHKKMPKNVDIMLEAVNEAFYELDPKTLSNVWMTLQYVMNEILKAKGGNDFELPHMGKRKLEAQGNLDPIVKAPMWAVVQAWDNVNGAQETEAEEATTNAGEDTQATSTLNAMQETQEQDTQATTEVYPMQGTQVAASKSYALGDN